MNKPETIDKQRMNGKSFYSIGLGELCEEIIR